MEGNATVGELLSLQEVDLEILRITGQLVTYEEALTHVGNPDDFALRFKGVSGTSDSQWDDFEDDDESEKGEEGAEGGADAPDGLKIERF